METIWRDLRYTCRILRKSPTFSLTAVLALTLGIGANTAIFSVVQSVLLRPLPYRDASRLVQVWNTYPPALPQAPNSAGDFRDFRKRSQTFSEMGRVCRYTQGFESDGRGRTGATGNEVRDLRIVCDAGNPTDGGARLHARGDNPGQPLTVLISDHLWQARFGSNPAVVGRTVALDGRGYAVAGVLPEDLRLGPRIEIWLPIGQYDPGPDLYRFHEFNIIGLLKPGVNIEQAHAELITLNAGQQNAFPDTHQNFGISVSPMQDPFARRMRMAALLREPYAA